MSNEWETKGRWLGAMQAPGYSGGDADDPDGVSAVHAALLHTGRVLLFSGYYENNRYPYRSWDWDPTIENVSVEDGRVVDVEFAEPIEDAAGRSFVPGVEDPGPEDDPDVDLFCAHHVATEDGRLLVVGGDAQDDGRKFDNKGLHFYDPEGQVWSKVDEQMIAGRWYPTVVVLPDGRVVIVSGATAPGYTDADIDYRTGAGHHGTPLDILEDVEVAGPPDYVPRTVSSADKFLDIYPGMNLAPDGQVYFVPTAWDYLEHSDADALRDDLETDSFRMIDEDHGSWEGYDDVLPDNPSRQEGTFVLLPPARDGRIMIVGGEATVSGVDADPTSCEILDTGADPPTWTSAASMNNARINVSAVLLPDGNVLVVGGHDGSSSEKSAELYDPIADEFTELAAMEHPRNYHSTVLLLPDGRVLTAGGVDGVGHGDDPLSSMEFFEPPYMHREGSRPRLTGLTREDGPDDQLRYGGEFHVEYDAAADVDITDVVLMRPGSITHHTDTEQRYVDVDFVDEGEYLRATVTSDTSVLPPGYYMVWIVGERETDGGETETLPCERAEFARVSHEACSLITDRSHFSMSEYEATDPTGATAEFPSALYVIVHGFVPEEVDVTDPDPSTRVLQEVLAPDVEFLDDGEPVDGIEAEASQMYLESPSDALDERQRITFEYEVSIHDSGVFPAEDPDPEVHEERVLDVRSEFEGYTCSSEVRLVQDPNPFMIDGKTHWLSTDLRVFQVREGEHQSGETLSAGQGALDYLDQFLSACETTDDTPGHPFRQIETDQREARLELASEVDGDAVYDFAVARVRLKAPRDVTASDVHLFFRLFTTAVTNFEYRDRTYPRSDGPPAVAEPGTAGDEVVSIPCYGTPRSEVGTRGDERNVRTLGGGGAVERDFYFGAWLDINQNEPQIRDPADGERKPIKELIRGRHQCLVSEIYYDRDPIPSNATPASNDNLSQRNLAIVESDNPGDADSHTAVHTFDVEPTWPPTERLQLAANARWPDAPRPDELAIFWGDLPESAEATLYLPALDADAIVRAARHEDGPTVVEKVDPHTVRCEVADVTYVPLPAVDADRVAGVLTVQLPDDVREGQRFRVVARHYSHARGRVMGSFELLIPVRSAEDVRDGATRDLGIFRHVASQLPAGSRWRPVFERYLDGLAGRVRGLGGDPTRVAPSPDGARPDARPPDDRPVCQLLTCLLRQDGVEEYLTERDVDVGELRACLEAVCGESAPDPGSPGGVDGGDVLTDPDVRETVSELCELLERRGE